MPELSVAKKQQLHEIAGELDKQRAAFNRSVVAIGQLLCNALKIHADNADFEAWAIDVTGFSRSTIERYVAVGLRFGETEPKLLRHFSDSALYTLAKKPPDVLAFALQKAEAGERIFSRDLPRIEKELHPPEPKKPTARASAKKDEPADEPKPKPKPAGKQVIDGFGNPVPKALHHVFSGTGREVADEAVKLCRQLKRAIDGLSAQDAGAFFAPANPQKDLQSVRASIEGSMPYCLCPKCSDDSAPVKCICQGRGWLPKKLYDRLSQAEQKWGKSK